MKIPFDKKWLMMEQEDYANYLFVSVTWESFTKMTEHFGFISGRFYGAEYIGSACNLFVLKEPYDIANKKHFQMLFTKPQAWDKLHRLTVKYSDELFALGRRILRIDPQKLSDKELVSWIDRFQLAQAKVHVPRGPMFLLETPENIVTDYLMNYLKEKAEDIGRTSAEAYEAFHVLTTPLQMSIWAREKEELAAIACLEDGERKKRLRQHAKKYEWLEYGLQGKILSPDHFAQEMKKLARIKKRQSFTEQVRRIKARQEKLLKEYNVHPAHKRIFRIVQDSFHTRLYSKDSQFYGYYCMEGLLREFGRRAALTLEQVRFLAHRDFKAALLQNKDFSELANERKKYSLFICDKGQTAYFAGKEAKRLRSKLKFVTPKEEKQKGEELRGQPAFAGRTKGRVKIINTIPEMTKIHKGNVLVSRMTNPGIVPAMKLSAAIVTDLGGITCHAAIVARELKIPCVIGTKLATKILKDGDLVEVDANKGIVKKL